jgi:phosphatidylserine/phosphatidylglycerophosphate/cardiolipin synthase-like enzyme
VKAARAPGKRRVELTLLRDRDHYDTLVAGAVARARVSLWIATANVKELRVEAPVGTRAHAGLPSRAFRAELAKHPRLRARGFRMRRCPRVHLKMIAVDGSLLYLGSANFTGAGLGAKGENRRNFEAGVLTDDDVLLDEMQGAFDAIWSGKQCSGCALRPVCPAPIDTLLAAR